MKLFIWSGTLDCAPGQVTVLASDLGHARHLAYRLPQAKTTRGFGTLVSQPPTRVIDRPWAGTFIQ